MDETENARTDKADMCRICGKEIEDPGERLCRFDRETEEMYRDHGGD